MSHQVKLWNKQQAQWFFILRARLVSNNMNRYVCKRSSSSITYPEFFKSMGLQILNNRHINGYNIRISGSHHDIKESSIDNICNIRVSASLCELCNSQNLFAQIGWPMTDYPIVYSISLPVGKDIVAMESEISANISVLFWSTRKNPVQLEGIFMPLFTFNSMPEPLASLAARFRLSWRYTSIELSKDK